MKKIITIFGIVLCEFAYADIGLTIRDIERNAGVGSFAVYAEPNPIREEEILLGAYSVIVKFDAFNGDFDAIKVDTVNLIPGLDDAGPLFGTTPHPLSVASDSVVQFVGFGRGGMLPAEGGPLVRYEFAVDGIFDEESSFRVSTVAANPEDPENRFSAVTQDSLFFDAKVIGHAEPCDVDINGLCDALDIDLLSEKVLEGVDIAFDNNADGQLNKDDRLFWVVDLMNTYLGDANLDLEFNSGDLISVFQAGEYEDNLVGNSSWSTGDWTGDQEVGTADLVAAFQQGGYEQGPRASTRAVPEPSLPIALLVLITVFFSRFGLRRA